MSMEDVRAALPLRYVCALYDILLEDDSALCPFHDDHNPSFDLFRSSDDTHDRWACAPCGVGGDVYDLIQAKEDFHSLPRAINRAKELLDLAPEATLTAPRPRPRAVLDVVMLEQLLTTAQTHAEENPEKLTRPVGMDPGWVAALVLDYGWGVTDDGFVLIPHYDEDAGLTGIKTRSPAGAKSAVDGSRFPTLYGLWMGFTGAPVILCEGETDTVVARGWYPSFDALGLPRGSGSLRAEWVHALRGREVLLAFDGDEAGKIATQRWWRELYGVAARQGVLHLPLGHDLRSAQLDESELIKGAQWL